MSRLCAATSGETALRDHESHQAEGQLPSHPALVHGAQHLNEMRVLRHLEAQRHLRTKETPLKYLKCYQNH